MFAGAGQEGVREFERCTSIAREVGPAAHAGALIFEGQALTFAGEHERAAEALADAERIGAPVDAKQLGQIDTVYADLAMQRDRPHEALPHYVRSIEAAESRDDLLQVHFDLQGLANALARLEHDAAALEVHALAEAHGSEVGLSSTTSSVAIRLSSPSSAPALRRPRKTMRVATPSPRAAASSAPASSHGRARREHPRRARAHRSCGFMPRHRPCAPFPEEANIRRVQASEARSGRVAGAAKAPRSCRDRIASRSGRGLERAAGSASGAPAVRLG
jgi:hypothetical protein